jgi:transcriptional regulator with XRE-family HTH domain
MSEFLAWLEEALSERQWNYSELARQAGVSPAAVSQVFSGRQKPGLQFCFGVAEALGEPPERVLRLAGYLPLKPEIDETLEEILYLYRRMTPEARAYLRVIARAFAQDVPVARGEGTGTPVA